MNCVKPLRSLSVKCIKEKLGEGTRDTRGPEDAGIGRRASRRATESRGRARLGGASRVSALEGAEALLERVSLSTRARI